MAMNWINHILSLGDITHLFNEEGVFNYSTMLLREDLNLLVLGAREALYALDLEDISKKIASVRTPLANKAVKANSVLEQRPFMFSVRELYQRFLGWRLRLVPNTLSWIEPEEAAARVQSTHALTLFYCCVTLSSRITDGFFSKTNKIRSTFICGTSEPWASNPSIWVCLIWAVNEMCFVTQHACIELCIVMLLFP